MTSSDIKNNFVEIFNQLSTYMDLEHKFMCEVPESTLNSSATYNTLVGMSGEYEGNFMFGYTQKTALDIATKLMGGPRIKEIDIYAKSALADFFSDFCKRVLYSIHLDENVFASNPTYIAGHDMKAMISKVPSINLFFKINGEKFDISYYLEKT